MKTLAASYGRVRKAVFASITAGGPLLIVGLTVQDSPGGATLTGSEVAAAVVTAVVAAVAVYSVPNDLTDARPVLTNTADQTPPPS